MTTISRVVIRVGIGVKKGGRRGDIYYGTCGDKTMRGGWKKRIGDGRMGREDEELVMQRRGKRWRV